MMLASPKTGMTGGAALMRIGGKRPSDSPTPANKYRRLLSMVWLLLGIRMTPRSVKLVMTEVLSSVPRRRRIAVSAIFPRLQSM